MPRQNNTRALVWLRRDLRLRDSAALARATENCEAVALAFVFDKNILDPLQDRSDRRVSFIHGSLAEIDRTLRERGSKLLVCCGDPVIEIPRLAAQLGVDAVFVNRDTEPYAMSRDESVKSALIGSIKWCEFKDQVLLESREVISQSGSVFRSFTPYRRAWLSQLRACDVEEHCVQLSKLWPIGELPSGLELPDLSEIGFTPSALWTEPGESAGFGRLEAFAKIIDAYAERRDVPAADGTSGLSVYLRFGNVSIRRAFRLGFQSDTEGAVKWRSELIWREFYQMILANNPHLVEHAFRSEFDGISWSGEDAHFTAWASGTTGYPLVDAAMRCLNTTGWMHNRLRMVTASFLVKDLLIDWRRGERYFAEKLLDFDLAQNVGGWQWCASVGVDALPAFRIFNPVLQSRKFDPDGEFIRRWCPELAHLDAQEIHWPHEGGLFRESAYPRPIVDHQTQRVRALGLYASAGRLRSEQ